MDRQRLQSAQIEFTINAKREPNYADDPRIWDTVRRRLRRREAHGMIAVVKDKLDEISALCREYGVLRLELFGSAATGKFDPERSDIDFIVEYPKDYDFGLWLTRYFEFRKRLEELLGYPVDLVMIGAMRNPYFVESVNESRQHLYAA